MVIFDQNFYLIDSCRGGRNVPLYPSRFFIDGHAGRSRFEREGIGITFRIYRRYDIAELSLRENSLSR